MRNDVASMRAALLRRGWRLDEITVLEDPQDAATLLTFLQRTSARYCDWQSGLVYLYVSSHGTLDDDARPGIKLSDSDAPSATVWWDDAFRALALPPTVNLLLLPDC